MAKTLRSSYFKDAPLRVDYVFMWVDSNNWHVKQSIEEALRKRFIPHPPHVSRVRDDGTFQFAVSSLWYCFGIAVEMLWA